MGQFSQILLISVDVLMNCRRILRDLVNLIRIFEELEMQLITQYP